jgi:hypothetical protein
MRLAIMQPTYLPWLGYFDLIDQVDHFVFLDQVEFSSRSWQRRNRIKTSQGLKWLTVPVRQRRHQVITEVEIALHDFGHKHMRTIQTYYARASYFGPTYEGLCRFLDGGRSWRMLADLNIELITWLSEFLGVRVRLHRSSALGQQGKRTGLLARICEKLGCEEYLSPLGSAVYLLEEQAQMTDAGIRVLFQHYAHPTYVQLFPPFLPYASVIDLLLNEGPAALEIIRSGRREAYTVEQCRGLLASTRGIESDELCQDWTA